MTRSSPESLVQVFANGRKVSLAAPATLADLIAALDLTGKRLALEWNGQVVPRSRHTDTQLGEGDRIEIVQAVGGG